MKKKAPVFFIGIFILMFWGSCQKPVDFDKQAMLEEIVRNYVVPTYQQLEEDNEEMELICLTFLNSPNIVGLTNLQNAWKKTMRTWSEVEMLYFGPGRVEYRYLKFDNTPISTSSIENAIADTVLIDSLYITNRSSYSKGLASIEYLLFDANANQQLIVDLYNVGINKARRSSYLLSCIKNTKTITNELTNEWRDTYGQTISTLTDNSTSGGIGNFSNAIIHFVQTIARKKLGKALGKESVDSLLHLEYLESPYAHYSSEIILHNIKGVKNLFGTKNNALGSYLADIINNEDLSIQITNKVATIEQLIEARSLTLYDDLTANTAEIEIIYQELKGLYEILHGEMASYFSIVVLSNPDDGD
jgi:predicted lipoprotein